MKNWLRRDGFWNLITLMGFVIIGLLVIYPLFNILMQSFISLETDKIGLGNYVTFFTTPYYLKSLLNSLVVSLGGTLGAVILGVPLAFFTTRYKIFGTPLLSSLATLALLTPPFLGAYSWIVMLGRNGFLTNAFAKIGVNLPTIYGAFGIILVYALQYYPFVFLLTSNGLQTIDRSLEEAASNMGATPFKRFYKVTMPLVTPSITSGALMVFMLSLANFGTPQIIGGRYRVLPTMAYNMYTSEISKRPAMASTISIILVLVAAIGIFLQKFAARRRKYSSVLLYRSQTVKLTGASNFFAHFISYLIVALSTLPMGVVVVFAFKKTKGPVFVDGYGLDSFRQVSREVPTAIANSFIYSIVALVFIVVIGTLLGFIVTRRQTVVNKILDTLLMTPYIVPGTVMGIGLIIAFNKPPIILYGTALIVIISYFIRRLPYSVRSASSILQQIDPDLEDAGISLGASPARAFRKVAMPLMIPGIVSGAVMSWITSINELSASILLYVGNTTTMPIRIYAWILGGYFGPAAALATILLVTTGVALFLLNVFGRGKVDIV
ncbi:MAG TPA: iron ABC transporter permease [Spirochaetales bacterium]|jgi:iron(III) transport system permease protein|nr:iron ABC transporter permease [Spirochaetales bacterium]